MRKPGSGNTADQEEMMVVRACQRGEREAQHALFLLYRERVFRLAYRFAGNAEDAEDLAQEVFLRVFERIGSYRGEAAFSSWVYRLATNHCLNRQRKPPPDQSLDAMRLDAPDASARDPATAALCGEREERIRQAIRSLPDPLRAVFILAGLEGLAYAEVARVLGISVEAARMRMSRARRELRKRLEGEGVAP